MSSRRPRRQRRRRDRASTLPRPNAAPAAQPATATGTSARIPDQTRPEHHVAADYRYVRRDLIAVVAVSAVTLAFVLIMAAIT